MNKIYSYPLIAQIYLSSIFFFFPLYLSHAWLTSGGLNQHWKWPMLLDLPLPLSPFLHLIVVPLGSSSPTAFSMIGLASPANPEGKHSLRVSLSHPWNKLPAVKKTTKMADDTDWYSQGNSLSVKTFFFPSSSKSFFACVNEAIS